MKNRNNWVIFVVVFLVIAAGAGYYFWQKDKTTESENSKTETKKIEEAIKKVSPNPDSTESIGEKTFENTDHNITITYPDNWKEADLGGDKKVTDPMTRENIAYFYLPDSETATNNPGSAIVSVKLLRFVLEDGTTINNIDDFYNYIKAKIDDFVGNPLLSSGYELKSLEKSTSIDGKSVVVENYVEDNLITGKDYYISAKGELYQFVTKAPSTYYEKFVPQIEKIVNSINFGK